MYIPEPGRDVVTSGGKRLDFIIGAVNMATPGLIAVEAGLANLTAVGMRTGSQITNAFRTAEAAMFGFGVASAFVFGKATAAAAEFERQLNLVKAVSGDVTDAQMRLLEKGVKRLAVEYGRSLNEITNALQTIGRAGLKDTNSQLAVFETGLKVATIEGSNLEKTMENVIRMTSLWGGKVDQKSFPQIAENVMNKFVSASQMSPTTVEDLVLGMQYLGGAAKQAGWTIDETLSILSALSRVGVTGSVAGVAVRGFLQKIAAPDKPFQEGMAMLGMTVEDLTMMRGGKKVILPPDQLIAKILKRMDELGMDNLERTKVWRLIGQARTAQQLMKLDPSEIQKIEAGLHDSNKLGKSLESVMNDTRMQFQRIKSSVEVITVNIGQKLLPQLKALSGAAMAFASAFTAGPFGEFLSVIAAMTLGLGLFMGSLIFMKFVMAGVSFAFDVLRGANERLRRAFEFTSQTYLKQCEYLSGWKALIGEAAIEEDALRHAARQLTAEIQAQTTAVSQNMMAWQSLAVSSGIVAGYRRAEKLPPLPASEWSMLAAATLSRSQSAEAPLGFTAYPIVTQRNMLASYLRDLETERGEIERRLALSMAYGISEDQMESLANRRDALRREISEVQYLIGAYPKITDAEKFMLRRTVVAGEYTPISLTEQRIRVPPTVTIPGGRSMIYTHPVYAGAQDRIAGLIESGAMVRAGAATAAEASRLSRVVGAVRGGLSRIYGVLGPLGTAFLALEGVTIGLQVAMEKVKEYLDSLSESIRKSEDKIDRLTDRLEDLEKKGTRAAQLESKDVESEIQAEKRSIAENYRKIWETRAWLPQYSPVFDERAKKYRLIGDDPYIAGTAPPWMYQATATLAPYFEYAYVLKESAREADKLAKERPQHKEAYTKKGKDLRKEEERVISEIADKYFAGNKKIARGLYEQYLLQQKIASARKAQSKAYMHLISAIGKLFSSIVRAIAILFGFGRAAKTTGKKTKEGSNAMEKAVDQQTKNYQQMYDSTLQAAINIEYLARIISWFADYVIYVANKLVNFGAGYGDQVAALKESTKKSEKKGSWIEKNIPLVGKTIAGIYKDSATKSKQRAKEIEDKAKKEGVPLQKPKFPSREEVAKELMKNIESAGAWRADPSLYGIATGGTGGAGGTGKGGGAGAGGGKGGKGGKEGVERILREGYNIDFIICSKKRLPDLDPHLFKKKYNIDLKRQTIEVKNLQVHTTDKPENIQAAVQNALIRVAESDRV